ncbi:MAG: hypothetical protein ACRCSN_13475 [Dermatophilaceae bacterium]
MDHRHRSLSRRVLALGGAAVLTAAVLVPGAAAEPSRSAPTEQTERPRLVVAHDTGVVVLDARTLATLGSFDLPARPGLSTSGDGRHVFLTPSATGTVRVLDTGDPQARGAERRPAMERGVIPGLKPAHVNGEHGRTAVFDDGTGTVTVVDDDQLDSPVLETRVFAPHGPHHGVAVPLTKGYLVSVPAEGSTSRVGVARMTEQGRIAQRWDTCPGLHGEAHGADGLVAFGCEDGIFTYRDGTAGKIAEPSDVAGQVGTLAGSEESTVLAGNYTETQMLLADTATGATKVVDLGQAYGSFTRDEHGDVVVLGTDGKVHVVDPETGEIESSVTAVPAWTRPAEYTTPRPVMTVVGHEALVTDPGTQRVVRVDLERGKLVRSVAFPAAPTALVATGTGGHQH